MSISMTTVPFNLVVANSSKSKGCSIRDFKLLARQANVPNTLKTQFNKQIIEGSYTKFARNDTTRNHVTQYR